MWRATPVRHVSCEFELKWCGHECAAQFSKWDWICKVLDGTKYNITYRHTRTPRIEVEERASCVNSTKSNYDEYVPVTRQTLCIRSDWPTGRPATQMYACKHNMNRLGVDSLLTQNVRINLYLTMNVGHIPLPAKWVSEKSTATVTVAATQKFEPNERRRTMDIYGSSESK